MDACAAGLAVPTNTWLRDEGPRLGELPGRLWPLFGRTATLNVAI